MTSPRNTPPDPFETVEDLLKNFNEEVWAEKPDFEVLRFLVSRIQRVALQAIAHPTGIPSAMVAPGVESEGLKNFNHEKLAQRALVAAETLERAVAAAVKERPGDFHIYTN